MNWFGDQTKTVCNPYCAASHDGLSQTTQMLCITETQADVITQMLRQTIGRELDKYADGVTFIDFISSFQMLITLFQT